MLELIKKINDLAFDLEKAIAKEDERAKTNTSKEAALDGREAKIIAKEDNLSAREKAVSKIEDIVKMRDDAILKMKEAERLIAKTQDERATNDKSNKDASDDLARRKEAVTRDEANILDEKKSIKEAWRQVRAKEASYRADIEKEVLAKFRK